MYMQQSGSPQRGCSTLLPMRRDCWSWNVATPIVRRIRPSAFHAFGYVPQLVSALDTVKASIKRGRA